VGLGSTVWVGRAVEVSVKVGRSGAGVPVALDAAVAVKVGTAAGLPQPATTRASQAQAMDRNEV
jgi:hypothetical protein